MMRLLAQRLAQEFLVELLDIGILMTLTDWLAFVFCIEGIATLLNHIKVAMVVRLTSTTNTSTWACHNLNYMVVELASAKFVHDNACVAQCVSHTNLELKAVEINFSLTDTLKTAHLVKVDARQCLACVNLINRTQSCFHHATSNTKDGTCTC